MSPMMIRIFTLVGIALAAFSLQLKARPHVHATGTAIFTSYGATAFVMPRHA